MTPPSMRKTGATPTRVTIFITRRVVYQSVKNMQHGSHYHRRRARTLPKQGRSPAIRARLRRGAHNTAITAQSACTTRAHLQDTRQGRPRLRSACRRARCGAAAQTHRDSCQAWRAGKTQQSTSEADPFGYNGQTREIRQRAPLRSAGRDPHCRARRSPCGRSRRVSGRGAGVQRRIRSGDRDKTGDASGAGPRDLQPLHSRAKRSSEAPAGRAAPAAAPISPPKDQGKRFGAPETARQARG